jgi:hypothetical protein
MGRPKPNQPLPADAPLVAEWVGHTVQVLLRIYAHCTMGTTSRGSGRWMTR